MRTQRKHPTILVSGIAGGSLSLWLLDKRLRHDGIDATSMWSPPVLRHHIEFYADRLRERIHKMYAKTGKPITLVGWSMGGLISVHAMTDARTAPCVKRIITFGTPFEGCYPAYALSHSLGEWFLKAPEQILPGSEALQHITHLILDAHRTWELITINGPVYLDPFAPGPLNTIDFDLGIVAPYSHIALFANRSLHHLVATLIQCEDLTTFK